jgi:hypothetical protein
MSVVVERLMAFGAANDAAFPPSAVGTVVGLGWATVDLERAVQELGGSLGIPAQRFTVAADAELLGARCRVASAALPDGSSLVVLEPATEGRLAATLARLGEGPAVIWLVAPEGLAAGDSGTTIAASSGRPGPFGQERLVLGGPPHGPHRLLVAPPATISTA